LEKANSVDDLFLASPAVNKRLWEYALAKKTPANILLTGKTGVGKTEASEVIAKHRLEAAGFDVSRYYEMGKEDETTPTRQGYLTRWIFRNMEINLDEYYHLNIDWGHGKYLQINSGNGKKLKDEALETPFLLIQDLDEMFRFSKAGEAKLRRTEDTISVADALTSLKVHTDNGVSGYSVIATATCPQLLPKWVLSMFDIIHLEPPQAKHIFQKAKATLKDKNMYMRDETLMSMLSRVCEASDGDIRQVIRALNRYEERRHTLSLVK